MTGIYWESYPRVYVCVRARAEVGARWATRQGIVRRLALSTVPEGENPAGDGPGGARFLTRSRRDHPAAGEFPICNLEFHHPAVLPEEGRENNGDVGVHIVDFATFRLSPAYPPCLRIFPAVFRGCSRLLTDIVGSRYRDSWILVGGSGHGSCY